MFKTRQDVFVIKAESTAPLNTGVVFYSHDRGTAKFLFQLKKDQVNQSLPKGTLVPISLDFLMGDVKGKHIYHATIEDAVEGLVSIILKDNILWFQGKVTGSIYIELPDSRSLDTAGRFTFEIRRSPIDLTTPPEQHFYWDGFHEILQEYEKTIEYIRSESKKLLDTLTTNVNNVQAKVNKLEQDIEDANTDLNTRIDEIHKRIDDEEIYRKSEVFTKKESSANVIYQVIGKDSVDLTLRFDFKGKVQGSLVENPHDLKGAYGVDLMPPSGGWGESATASYERSSIQDGVLYSSNTTVANERRQLRFGWNVLEGVTRLLGEQFFSSQGLLSVSQKVNFIRTAITELSSNVFGFGASSTGNKLTLATWRSNYSAQDWLYNAATTANSVVNIKSKVPGASVYAYIDDNGNVYNIVYADPSDGVKPSTVNIDFAYLDIKISISMNEFIRSMIAANHVENIATQEEAESGTNNTKTMTPLRVNEVIDKKAVTLTGNQTIGGIKNLKDGLLVDEDTVVGINDHSLFVMNSENTPNISTGTAYFVKHGSIVIANGSIKFKNAISFGSVISNTLPAEFSSSISNGIMVGHTGSDAAKAMYTEKGTTNIKANNDFAVNEWFTFSGTYWTGEDE